MLPLLSLERPLACGVVAGREVLPHSALAAAASLKSMKKVGRLENRVVRGRALLLLIVYMYMYMYLGTEPYV